MTYKFVHENESRSLRVGTQPMSIKRVSMSLCFAQIPAAKINNARDASELLAAGAAGTSSEPLDSRESKTAEMHKLQ